MSKSKASRRARDAKHVRLYLYMMKSPAWLSLSCQAKCLLIELQALYNGTNNGELFMSVRTAATLLRTGTKQARAAFAELEDRGFIRATRKGTRTRRGEVRMATCWRLTEHDDDLTGRQPTKEFMTWRPGEKNLTVVPENTHRGPREHGTAAKEPENTFDRGPREHAPADFEASTVVPENTQLVNHIETLRLTEPLSQSAPPTAGPHTQNSFSKPKGSQRQRAEWLHAQLKSGALSVDDVMSAIGIGFTDVFEVASGKTALSTTAWKKLAAVVAGRMN